MKDAQRAASCFAMAFDPIFRWLQDAIIPRNLAGLDFFHPVPCAYADNFAVAASSFRCLMTALAPSFQIMDQIDGLNLNHRKCCWVQYVGESCQSLFDWVATNCEKFRELKVVKYAKYGGTMFGPEGHAHFWTSENSVSVYQKAWLRDCDIKIWTLSVLGFVGSTSAPDDATLKAEAHALQCMTAGPYNAIPTSLLCVGSVCGLGPDLVGIRSVSLAARYGTAACSNTLSQGLEKIQAARGYDFAPIFAVSSDWEKKFLAPSMARCTAKAFNIVCCLDRSGKLDGSPLDKKQKAATALTRDKLYEQDFAVPNSVRASGILGPISRFRIVEILPHIELVSRAARPGLTVGFLRLFCNVLRTTQISFTRKERNKYVELDGRMHPTLSHTTTSVPCCTICLPPYGGIVRRGHRLHDLITQVFFRCLQYGIVVMGVIDAFDYALNHHRRNFENPGNLWGLHERENPLHDGYHSSLCSLWCSVPVWTGRSVSLSPSASLHIALTLYRWTLFSKKKKNTPAYAHAYQVTCLTRHIPAV